MSSSTDVPEDQMDSVLLRCSGISCGKFYHDKCIKKLTHTSYARITAKDASGRVSKFICPVRNVNKLIHRHHLPSRPLT